MLRAQIWFTLIGISLRRVPAGASLLNAAGECFYLKRCVPYLMIISLEHTTGDNIEAEPLDWATEPVCCADCRLFKVKQTARRTLSPWSLGPLSEH